MNRLWLVLVIGIFNFINFAVSSNEILPEPLPPEKAFRLSANYDSLKKQVEVSYQIEKGYYLYRHKISVKTKNSADADKIQQIVLPKGIAYFDKFFGDVEIYRYQLFFTAPITSLDSDINLLVTVQGCADFGICYPPFEQILTIKQDGNISKAIFDDSLLIEQSDITNSQSLLQSTESSSKILEFEKTKPNNSRKDESKSIYQIEAEDLANRIGELNILSTIIIFFLLGLALSLTPCVLPMIPILGALITSKTNQSQNLDQQEFQRNNTEKEFKAYKFKNLFLATAFVLGTSITYTIVGVVAGYTGGLFTNTIQMPLVQVISAIIIILLALTCFGLLQIQMPIFLQNILQKYANKQSNNWFGLIIAGAITALIIGPCVAAPLIAVLIYISQTGDALIGGSLLFVLAWGQGIPLLLFGFFTDKALPKMGNWMVSINHLFGFLLLLLAIWMISPLITDFWELLIYGCFFIFTSVFLDIFAPLPKNANFFNKIVKSIAILLLIYGVSLLIGAFSGGNNLFKPLSNFTMVNNQNFTSENSKTLNSQTYWEVITNPQEFESEISKTLANDKPTIIKYSADWCISCKEFETFTLSDQRVQKLLTEFNLIYADVTESNAKTNSLLKQFNLYGPPALIFIYGNSELRQFRLIGVESAEDFSQRLKSVLAKLPND